jgi:hypothetical protein
MIVKDHVMRGRPLRSRARVISTAIVLLAMSAGASTRAQVVNGTGTVTTAAPVYVLPDANRVPLATLPAGTAVEVLSKQGIWYQIVFYDVQLGNRTAYALAASVRVDPPPPARPPSRAPVPPAESSQPPNTPKPPTAGDVRARVNEESAARGLVSVNATDQRTSTAFAGTTTFSQNAETGSLTTNYDGRHPIVVDVAGAAKVWRALAIVVAGTWTSQTGNASVSAGIPHPFKFDAPRSVSGVTSGLKRREIALHLDPALLIPLGGSTNLMLFGGPSYFRVNQNLVTGITATEVYPYDTATFASTTTEAFTRSRIGFNAGFDITVGFSKYVGVGALARYSRAPLTFTAGDGGDVEVKAGGLQIGGGLRFRF